MNDVTDPCVSQKTSPLLRTTATLDMLSRGQRSRSSTRVLTDSVYTRLRDAIMSAELRPNRRLVEDDLSEWLNVSRTPVREALLRLEQEGLVERSRGWVVKEYDPAEIRFRLECRLGLESFASRLAAERRTNDHLTKLRRVQASMRVPGISRYELNAQNDRFHLIIVEASGNPALLSLHAQVKMNYWDLNFPIHFTTDDDRSDEEQHDALIEALAARDADAAERISKEHINCTLRIVVSEYEARLRGQRG